MQVVFYIVGEILVEHIYRTVVGGIWRKFQINTNVFIDAWVGEGCFLAAAVTTIIIVSRFSPSRKLYVYKGPVLNTIAGISIGLIVGFSLKAIQFQLLKHFDTSIYYITDTKPYFPAANEAIYCLAVAVTEETAFRAYLFPHIEKTWGTGIALFTTSAIFALGHLTNQGALSSIANLLYTLTVTFSGGLMFAACLVLTERIWMSIALHFSVNFFLSVAFGDDAVGVLPVGMMLFGQHRGDQLSVVLNTSVSIILLGLAVRKGKWKSRASCRQDSGTATTNMAA